MQIVQEPVAIKGVPWDFSAEIVTLI